MALEASLFYTEVLKINGRQRPERAKKSQRPHIQGTDSRGSFCLVWFCHTERWRFLYILHNGHFFLDAQFGELPKRKCPGALFGKTLQRGVAGVVGWGVVGMSKDKLCLASPHPPWRFPLMSHPWDAVMLSLPAVNPVFSCSGFHGLREQTLSMLPGPLEPGGKSIVNPTQFWLLVTFYPEAFFPTP